jgi:hypothetical protein
LAKSHPKQRWAGLVEAGDVVSIDVQKRFANLEVSEGELARRRALPSKWASADESGWLSTEVPLKPAAVIFRPAPAIAVPPALPDPAFALIAEKRAMDIAQGEAIDAQEEAEGRYGIRSDEASEADDRCEAACWAVNAIDWRLATTPPMTLAGIAAVLRFANEHEDAGGEWPNTDAVGRDGWHYQLRATMAAAIEALIKAPARKAVQS